MRTLQECLLDYDTTLLRAIAERRGVELTSDRPPEMVRQLSAALCDPTSLTETLTWLTDQERLALSTLLSNRGRLSLHRFSQQFGDIRRLGPGRMAADKPWHTPINAAEGLWYLGLIGRGFAEQAGVSTEFVFIPADLLPLLPAPSEPPPFFQTAQTAPPDRVVVGNDDLVDDMGTLLTLAQNRQMPPHRATPDATYDLLHGRFLIADPLRTDLVLHLAQAASFLDRTGSVTRLNRDPTRDWLKLPRAEQLGMLQRVWHDDLTWNDLWHVPGLLCEDTGWRNDPLSARQAVTDLLRRCPAAAWLSISGWTQEVHAHMPDWLRPDGDLKSWYIRDARTGEYLIGAAYWDRVEGALLNYLLTGPLHWLGILSIGYRANQPKPVAFQIGPWGAAFLGREPTLPEMPAPTPAQIDANGRIRLSRRAPLFDRFQLARFAEWQSSSQDYEYLITPTAMRRALSEKISPDSLEQFLQRISQHNVPAGIVAAMRGWAARYGLVRLRQAAILETRRPHVMQELRSHERISAFLRQSLSPTMSLVRLSDWDSLVQELERAGYLPDILESNKGEIHHA